jgi:hypothetical protein
MAQCSECKQLSVPDDRCGPRTARVRLERPVRVVHGVLMTPKQLAGRRVKTEHVLLGHGPHYLGVSDVNAALNNNGTGPTPSDRDTPRNLQPVRRERFHDTRLVPHSIAIRPAPLRPIFRSCHHGQQ